jgi:small subunit ribosomal protein S16
MLAIRMQRTGRKGHAMFRMIVQEARLSPASGKVVAQLGSYDPHAKTITLNKELAVQYLEKGARPSERIAHLLVTEGVKLPSWVPQTEKKTGKIRNPEKLRRNRPAPEKVAAEEPAKEVAAEPATEPAAEAETPASTEE